jgi:hypothetical protein
MSWPAMSLYLPSRLNPVILPTIILGLTFCKTSGPNPNFSKTPGRNGSITTSACLTKLLTSSTPALDFRFAAIEVLWRVRGSVGGGGGLLECVALGIARSIRRTEAPLSARSRPAKGPGQFVSATCVLEEENHTWSKTPKFEDADACQRRRANHIK